MGLVIFIIVLFYSFYLMDKIKERSKKDGSLTRSEKIQIIITEVFNPIVAGAVYYYGWKKTMPKNAKWANRYSWYVFGALILLGILCVGILYVLYPPFTSRS